MARPTTDELKRIRDGTLSAGPANPVCFKCGLEITPEEQPWAINEGLALVREAGRCRDVRMIVHARCHERRDP